MCLAYRLDSEDSCPEQLPATVCPLRSLIRKLPFVVASPADWTHATRCHRIDSRSPIWLTKHTGCAWHRLKYSIGPIFGVFNVMRPSDMTTTIMSHSYYVILVTFLHRAWVSASSRATAKLFSFTPSASMTSIDSNDDIANLSFPMRSHKSSRRKASWEYWNWDSLIISWSRGQSPKYLLDIKKQLLKWLVTRPCSLRNLRSVMLENDSWAGRLLSLWTISELIRMVCFWTREVPTCAHSPHCQSSCCCRATIILYFTKPWSFRWWTQRQMLLEVGKGDCNQLQPLPLQTY